MRRLALVLLSVLNIAWISGLAVGLSLYLDDELESSTARLLSAAAIYTAGNLCCLFLLWAAARKTRSQPRGSSERLTF